MPKKFEVKYTLTFHVLADDKGEAEKTGKKALFDWLKAMSQPTDLGFGLEITEL